MDCGVICPERLKISIDLLRANLSAIFFTCNYVVSVWRGFLFLWVLGMGCVILCDTPWAFHIIILQCDTVLNTVLGLHL